MLVVIVIIGLLAGLLVPAVMRAMARGREAGQLAEFNVLAQAMAALDEPPPSRVMLVEDGDYSAATIAARMSVSDPLPADVAALRDRSLRYLRKRWPRAALSTSGPTAQSVSPSTALWHDWNGNGVMDGGVILVDGFEALPLFLGGIPYTDADGVRTVNGFGRHPEWPAVPPFTDPDQAVRHAHTDGTRQPSLYTFALGRLDDRDGDGMPEYLDSLEGLPLAYFRAYGGKYDPRDCEWPGEPTAAAFVGDGATIVSRGPNPYTTARPVQVDRDGDPSPGSPHRWHRPDSFQLICAGGDGVFGSGGQFSGTEPERLPIDPLGPSLTAAAGGVPAQDRFPEADNLTNFHSTTLD